MTDVFKQLAIHLDKTPSGYPETESGVELRILKQLFTPDEAQLALSLMLFPETADVIAQRANKDVETVRSMLIDMGVKGTAIHVHRNGQDTFMLLHFVVGIWEYQVNRLTRELIKDFNEYVPYLIKNQYKNKTQQLRVVPVGKAVTTELNVMDYDQVETIIKSQSKILVAPCICRKEHDIMGNGCDNIKEACLIFGGGAYMYESRGIGRTISQDEALDILHKAVKQGLVPQPSNSKKPINICLCCSCCCQILKNIKNFDEPAKIVSSNYQACVDTDECTGCQACEEICPMDAITMDSVKIVAQVNLSRCIGCGLCVNACQFDAMHLMDKDPSERVEPPANLIETYMKIAREKGLF
ncbi:MAG: 4Fe-4S binding protein [Pseudomonadota bacterium]